MFPTHGDDFMCNDGENAIDYFCNIILMIMMVAKFNVNYDVIWTWKIS